MISGRDLGVAYSLKQVIFLTTREAIHPLTRIKSIKMIHTLGLSWNQNVLLVGKILTSNNLTSRSVTGLAGRRFLLSLIYLWQYKGL